MDIIKKEALMLFVPVFYCFLSLNMNTSSMHLIAKSYGWKSMVADRDNEISSYCTVDTKLTTNNYRDIVTVYGNYAETENDTERLHRMLCKYVNVLA